MVAGGPKRLLTSVGFSPPFALSLSKGQAEPAEALGMWHEGFDKLSPNGGERGFDRLSPNGSLQTLNFASGPTAGARCIHRRSSLTRRTS
jgi:hypothetical protein